MIYGYCRISTPKQNIERQIRNIKDKYPNAIIVTETYTGTKIDNRKEFNNILQHIKQGDTIVFDSVSRMSRNAEDGFKLYKGLFSKGITLVFLKEGYINTDTYKQAMNNKLCLTGDIIDSVLQGINEYLLKLAERQIQLAFAQAEKEVNDLRKRTKEGIETARLNGKHIGQQKGRKLNIKKKQPTMKQIVKYSKSFNGSLSDNDVIKLIGISRNTYYKYKKELFLAPTQPIT